MTVHLLKLCVGAETIDDLRGWVEKRVLENKRAGFGRVHHHLTRMHPRREAELLNGGSIYWVIKGVVQVRQVIVGFEKRIGADQIMRTAILLEPELHPTHPQNRRAFQGWRYLTSADAPDDLVIGSGKELPSELITELANLGLL